MGINRFKKWRNELDKKSNIVKDCTGNDLFDWIVLLLIFPSGLIFVYMFLSWGIITIKDALNAWFLWFSALFVIRATKDAYWVKVVMQKELETLRKAEMDKHRPLLVPRETAEIYTTGDIGGLRIRNLGVGIAKEITLTIGNIKIKEDITMVPNELYGFTVVMEKRDEVIELLAQERPLLALLIKYKDIYDRQFISHVYFKRNDEGIYFLERGKMQFTSP